MKGDFYGNHMSSEKARTGMTGKQLRKARKKARKAELQLRKSKEMK